METVLWQYLDKIVQKLEAIESLLQRLPETQAAVFIQMWDEYQSVRLQGKKPSDIWEINPPHQR